MLQGGGASGVEHSTATTQALATDLRPFLANREGVQRLIPVACSDLTVEQSVERPVGAGFHLQGFAGARFGGDRVAARAGCRRRAAQAGQLSAWQARELTPGALSARPVVGNLCGARLEQKLQPVIIGMLRRAF